jgi:hypothetical protein
MVKHTNDGAACPSCEEKLLQAHHTIAQWFRSDVKPKHQDAHISWSFRDKKSQNECVTMGRSKLVFPLSAHNKSDDQGNPCALALDLFKLCSNGMASWEWKFCKDIADEAVSAGAPILWGGAWKSLGDYDHFELHKPA